MNITSNVTSSIFLVLLYAEGESGHFKGVQQSYREDSRRGDQTPSQRFVWRRHTAEINSSILWHLEEMQLIYSWSRGQFHEEKNKHAHVLAHPSSCVSKIDCV